MSDQNPSSAQTKQEQRAAAEAAALRANLLKRKQQARDRSVPISTGSEQD